VAVIWFVNLTRRANEQFVGLRRPAGLTLTKHITAVLTKPDRIDPGDEGKWLDMLRNRTERFKHGWYCVKQPGFNDLQARISPEEAKANELRFFDTTRPWSTAEPDVRARFGMKALAKALSYKLFDVFSRRYGNPSTLYLTIDLLLASLRSRASSI
jgi:hypothetical protein